MSLRDISNLLVTEKDRQKVYIFFNEEAEYNRALDYLAKRKLDAQQMGYGVFEANNLVLRAFRKGKFNFGTAKSMKEIYENEFLIKYWNDLVERLYLKNQLNSFNNRDLQIKKS